MALLCRPELPWLSLGKIHRPSLESLFSFRTCLPLFWNQRALGLNCCASHSNARNLAYANHQKHKGAPFTFILACYLTSWGDKKHSHYFFQQKSCSFGLPFEKRSIEWSGGWPSKGKSTRPNWIADMSDKKLTHHYWKGLSLLLRKLPTAKDLIICLFSLLSPGELGRGPEPSPIFG